MFSNRIRFSLATVTVCSWLLATDTVYATTWDIDGVIDVCNPSLCGLAGLAPGNAITGFLKADSGAAGPNSTFTEVDITDYRASANGLSVGAADGSIDVATLTTDANGELVSGFLQTSGTFDGGILGLIDLTLTLDIGGGMFSITTTYLNLGEVANGPIMSMLEPDGDELARIEDNCTELANADQRDTNGDGFGNVCDADLNNDNVIDFADLPGFQQAFFTQDGDPNWNPDADINGDGVMDFGDLPAVQRQFFGPPGPSGLVP